jgi:hypothetical protein
MTDMIAILFIGLLLAALFVVRRRARQPRRRTPHTRRSQLGRTLSARTEMRAYSSASTTSGMLKKRSRHDSHKDWNRA